MAQHRRTLCAADASSPCASAKRQETTECAICGKVVRRGGLARHHLSDACRQAQRKLWPCSCCGPASGKEADIFAREVFGCNNGAVIIDGVDYAPKLSRAAHFNGYTPIPLPDRDHSPIFTEGRIPSETDEEPVATLVDLTLGRGSSGTLVEGS